MPVDKLQRYLCLNIWQTGRPKQHQRLDSDVNETQKFWDLKSAHGSEYIPHELSTFYDTSSQSIACKPRAFRTV